MYDVLLVDDVEFLRFEIKRLNIWDEKSGFKIAGEASDGREAIEELKNKKYDLVITDIRMPIIDGIELLEIIKLEENPPLVVLLSEHSDFSYAKKCIVLGAFDYMLKPVCEKDLIDILKRASEYYEKKISVKQDFQLESKILIYSILKGETESLKYVNLLVDLLFDGSENDNAIINSKFNFITGLIFLKLKEEYPWITKFIEIEVDDMGSYNNSKDFEDIREIATNYINKIVLVLSKYQIKNKDNMVQQICAFMLQNIDEDISLSRVSKEMCMNKDYMSQKFKVKTNMAFTEYLLMLKMDRAKMLLSDNNNRTYEIGYALGYNDPEYFSRIFKQNVGVTPREYKNRQNS